MSFVLFFFSDTATTEIYTLSLHDALPISYVYKDYEHVGPAKFFPAKMPYINKKPIGLSKNEILAVIAFLQNMSGEEVTVELSEIEVPGSAGSASRRGVL